MKFSVCIQALCVIYFSWVIIHKNNQGQRSGQRMKSALPNGFIFQIHNGKSERSSALCRK